MHSFIPEFEEWLGTRKVAVRLRTQDFATQLSDFYLDRWNTLVARQPNPGEEIHFIVGGYDQGEVYGRVFAFAIPTVPAPIEHNPGAGQFGISWGGAA